MNRVQFWKNFKLGKELDISGRFIYNGLRNLHEMESLYYEEEVFEFLYNISVGLERLIKIAVILIEHDENIDQEEFEKSLITHSHLDLLRRVQKKHDLTIASPHNEFMQLLCVFYKTHRYGRYSICSVGTVDKEKTAFHSFIKKYLKITINDEFPFDISQNSNQIQRFVGKIIGKVTSEIYKVVEQEASRLNIYTQELRYESKASKIFLRKEYEFTNEDVLWKELLIFFINSNVSSGHIGFIKNMEPLEFDPGLEIEYLQCLSSEESKLGVLDELEGLYLDIEKPGERLKSVNLIGNSSVFFDSDDEDEL